MTKKLERIAGAFNTCSQGPEQEIAQCYFNLYRQSHDSNFLVSLQVQIKNIKIFYIISIMTRHRATLFL